jgi:hypothetical protein
MLDYGDVTILGTGEGFETLRTIASPIELRNRSPERRTRPRAAAQGGDDRVVSDADDPSMSAVRLLHPDDRDGDRAQETHAGAP